MLRGRIYSFIGIYYEKGQKALKRKLNITLSLIVICLTVIFTFSLSQHLASADFSLNGQKIDLTGATATSDSKHSSAAVGSVDSIIDADVSTSWISATAKDGEYTPHWVEIALKDEITLNRIVLTPRLESGVAYYFPKSFTVKVSSDGNDWISVISESDYTLKGTSGDAFDFSIQKGIRYIKMEVTKNSSSNPEPYGAYYGFGLSEFEAYLAPRSVKIDLTSATATGESTHPSTKLDPAAVIDGNHSTSWVSKNDMSGEYTHRWVQLELDCGINLNKLVLIPRIENGNIVYFPKDFTIKLSCNGKNWITVADKTDYSVTSTSGDEFIFPLEKGIRFIRINTSRNTGGGSWYGFGLAEIEAYYDENANVLCGLNDKLRIASVSATSSHPIHPAEHLIDGISGNVNNIWSNNDLTKYNPKPDTELVLELAELSAVSGLKLYPRNHTTACNFPHKFSIYLSADNTNWSPAVYSTENYTLDSSTAPQNIRFNEVLSGVKYIKLVIAAGNNTQGYVHLAEIEAIGAVYEKAEQLASAIEIAEPKYTDAKLTLTGTSSLFSYEVTSATPAGVIDENGFITYPIDNAKKVSVTLKIYNLIDESDTATLTRTVTVKPEDTLKLEAVAADTNLIACPANDDEYVTLPKIDGYTVSIATSDYENIVALDGKITRPTESVGVRLSLLIKDNESGKTAETKPLLVPIYKPYTKPTMTKGEIDAIRENYEDNAYGVFVHYISDYYGNASVYADGTKLKDVDEAANAFDVEAFAKSMHEVGAEYVVLTLWHGDARTLFPSMTNRRWRDERRQEDTIGAKSYSERDIIAPLIVELEKYDIDLHLYTHPCDGHDFTPEDQMLTGWTDPTNNYEVWNQYINELYYELCERYGNSIKGLWFDGGYNHVDKARLRATCESFNPAMILVANLAFKEGTVFDPHKYAEAADYNSWEIPAGYNFLTDRRISRHQSAIVIAGAGWWTKYPNTATLPHLPTAEEMFKFTVAISSISKEGGFLASTGFYPIHEGEVLDDYFMPGIKDALCKLNTSYLTPMKESILNTNDSTAYPTTENITLNELEWGVANESKDGKTIYLHILNAPSSDTLTIPDTKDGRVLGKDAVIMNYDGTTTPITVRKIDGGYSISLPEGVEWSSVDTVIKADIHNYENIKYDAETHWKECECGAIDEGSREAHSGGTATSTERKTCSVCNQKYGEYAIEEKNENDENKPQKSGLSLKAIARIVISISAAVGCGGFVLFKTVKKKKIK